ncbi:hypothetical protein L1987_10487 [Smallanthus sonchifolius]|uniref:Uncharacterized protein n=1 Tax=Smallanthus sonchifolius TaxID=185202 RepID=A0ACB9JSF5_9ASTR|nr:hypothetical protein L1987_10487 [Smallanthus sonchifolius]
MVSVSPFPHPSPRRLSSHFTPPTRPVRSAKQLAWVSLQGRIVGSEEASSAKAIGGGLSHEEAVAWPVHRILIVAVIAVAASNSKKNKLIVQLKKSVQIRDQVLLGMQEKLDNLCEQVNYFKDKPDISSYNFEFAGCGCQHCNYHQLPSEYKEVRNEVDVTRKYVDDVDTIQSKLADDAEQEERRMSDLSDWAPSVSSSVDVQKECEEKNATIKELSDFLNSAESHNSKVIHLTRLRRPSSSKSNASSQKLPAMSDNLIYDMDSTTSPSDDSDSSARKKHRVPMINHMNKEDHNAANLNTQRPTHPNTSKLTVKSSEQPLRPTTPLKEKSLNQQANLVNLSKSKESKSVSGGYKSRNGTSSKSNKSRVPREHKRWS